LSVADRYGQVAVRAPADHGWPDAFMAEYLTKQAGRSATLKQAEEYEAQGRFREALLIYEQLVRAYPDEPAVVKLGVAQAKVGDYPAAEQTFRSALRMNPGNGTAHIYLGRCLLHQVEPLARGAGGTPVGRVKEALEEAVGEFRQGITLRPDNAPAYTFAGTALRLLGRLDEAESLCREAVRIVPHAAEAHLALGEVMLDAGKPAEAVREAEEAAKLVPGDPRPKGLLERARRAGGA
jgi:Flp pilus assembly protein TadD